MLLRRILISGGSGFVGNAITQLFTASNDEVFILTRGEKKSNHPKIKYVQWMNGNNAAEQELPQIDAVINLAGETINGRWTSEKKQAILNSRLKATEELLSIVKKMDTPPRVWINASAIGYYGTSQSKVFTEAEETHGTDFLAEVVKAWETKAKEASSIGCRTVITRFGLILGKDGGVLPQLTLPYRFFAGGTVGSGNQWVSWIHIDDVARLMKETFDNEGYSGPVNAASPNPVTMKEFGEIIGGVLKRPHWLPAPSFMFKLVFGEMSMLILKGQQVLPEKAMDNGFTFKYPNLKRALQDLLQ
ncbi:TIGR01777 family oxidoreductase [Fictibacillus barbaricus]|uniref:TIGR01777 family oxidoreductase n=1 Tax=Fictibacillus barbaricus TaxID=182136 RepID=UPI00286D1135|nr:TIGR01777 family oxidoreductase [Fictibacillus barbaricus]